MGNASSGTQGFYGISSEEVTFEDKDDFLVVTVAPPKPDRGEEIAEKTITPKSPFEVTEQSQRALSFEGSIDSGYADANKSTSAEGNSPLHSPAKPIVS